MSVTIKYEYSEEVQQVLDLLENRKEELEGLEYIQFTAHSALYGGRKQFHYSREQELREVTSQLIELKSIFKPTKVNVNFTSVESVVRNITLCPTS